MSSHFFGISTRLFAYSHTIGRTEFNGPGFRSPRDLGLASSGLIYVVNSSPEERPQGIRVTICTVDEQYLGEFGRYGEGDGEFIRPTSIALDSHENVYVADEWLNRISIFDKNGEFLTKWGEKGARKGELDRPYGLVFDKENNLYVADAGNHRVQRFTKDGKFLSAFGSAGDGNGEFNLPWGVTLDSDGDVYVADWGNDRIQKFSVEGRFLAKYGSSGKQEGEFIRPTGVAVDEDGDVYVVDWANHRVQVFGPDWRHLTTFTGDATLSKWGRTKLDANPIMLQQYKMVRDVTPWQQFWYPVAVELDAKGQIFITDSARNRIQVYKKERAAAAISG